MENIYVLYVGEESNARKIFKSDFSKFYDVYTASTLEEAWLVLQINNVDVLVYDQKISISERKIFLEMAAKTFPALALILLVEYSNTVEIVETINKELVFKYVLKPYQPEVLKNIIDSVYGIAVITKLTAAFQEELNLVKKELIQFKNTRSY